MYKKSWVCNFTKINFIIDIFLKIFNTSVCVGELNYTKDDIKVRCEVRGNYIENWRNGKSSLWVFWNSQINGKAPVMELLLSKVKGKILYCLKLCHMHLSSRKTSSRIFKKFPLNQCCPRFNATIDGLLTNFLEGTLKTPEKICGSVCCEDLFYRNKFFIE